MNDDEWEQQRNRSIMAAFETGRPVFADSEGTFKFADGACEPLDPETGIVTEKIRVSWLTRVLQWLGL